MQRNRSEPKIEVCTILIFKPFLFEIGFINKTKLLL